MQHLLLALALLLAPISRVPDAFAAFEPVRIALLVLTLLVWLGTLLRDQSRGQGAADALPPRALLALQIAFLAWLSLGMLFSAQPSAAGGRVLLTYFTTFAFVLPFFTLATREPETHRRLLQVFLATAAAVGSVAILQYVVMQFGVLHSLTDLIIPKVDRDLFLGPDPAPMPAWGYRSMGTFHHSNLLGLFLGLAVPLALVSILMATTRRARLVSTAAAVTIVAGLFASGSRGGWLNVAVGLGVLTLIYLPRIPWRIRWATIAVAALVVVLGFEQVRTYLRLDNLLSNRDVIWVNSWTMIAERPVVGWGAGTFPPLYLERFDLPSHIERFTAERELISLGRAWVREYWHAHNAWLHLATESGLPALLLLLGIFGFYGNRFVRARPRPVADDRHLLAAGCTAAISGNLVHSLLETSANFADLALGLPFAFVFATGLASLRKPEAPQ